MTLITTFTLADITKFIEKSLQRTRKAVLNAYNFAGEQFVIDARQNGDYIDRTGNLRSSIGYIVIIDGRVSSENFVHSGTGSDGEFGVQQGLTYAEELAKDYPKGVVLICVAGMDYAAAVESKGLDVITGSTAALENKLNSLLKNI